MNECSCDHRRADMSSSRGCLLSVVLSLGVGLLTAGCSTSTAPKATGGSFNPLYAVPVVGAKAKEDALRKRVEADPFPPAAKAGL